MTAVHYTTTPFKPNTAHDAKGKPDTMANLLNDIVYARGEAPHYERASPILSLSHSIFTDSWSILGLFSVNSDQYVKKPWQKHGLVAHS